MRQLARRWGAGYRAGMTPPITPSYAGHRFPPEVIGHAVWLVSGVWRQGVVHPFIAAILMTMVADMGAGDPGRSS